jgi:hypothetical protein
LIDVKQYIEFTKFDIDKLHIDKFWNQLKDNVPILIDDDLIRWLGFNGKIDKARYHLLRSLELYKIKLNEIKYDQLPLYRDSESKFENDSETNLKKRNFIILNSDEFRKLCMRIQTDRGEKIRDYYLALEKLIKNYVEYQYYYQIYHANISKIKLIDHIKQKEIECEKITSEFKQKEIEYQEQIEILKPKPTIEYIYRLLNTLTKQEYIGQTVRSIEDRFNEHKRETIIKPLLLLSRNMKTYGEIHFKCELIETISFINKNELNDRESYHIQIVDQRGQSLNEKKPIIINNYFCGTCNIQLKNKLTFKNHINSHKHKKNIEII